MVPDRETREGEATRRDPYQPPSAEIREPVVPFPGEGRLRPLPILVSALGIDIAGTFVVAGVIAFGAAIYLAAQGLEPEQIAKALPRSWAFLVAASLAGALLTLLSGYVAARWAGHREIAHAAACGGVSLGVSLLLGLIPGESPFPAWAEYAGLVLHLPVALAGGALAKRRRA